FRAAETAVPRTNPSCTIDVIQPTADESSCQRAPSCTDTALAANQSDIPRSSAHARRASRRQRRGSVSAAEIGTRSGELGAGMERLITKILTERPLAGDQHSSAIERP